jgi:phosphoribosyl 1,2-cyclic phosphodiesterase
MGSILSRKKPSDKPGTIHPAMKLTFLGTRGNIDVRSPRHRRHTATLVSYRGAHIMIDCGTDWLRTVHRVKPNAIVATHAHPDHVEGLKRGAPCPVYAPAAVWRAIRRWPIRERYRLGTRVPTDIRDVVFEVFPLDHSVIAPAAGYRITAGGVTVFYAPDVLRIRHQADALEGIGLHIGDGATITRPIVRLERQKGIAVGHASIATQLDWCAKADVPRAIFTHCGRAIVAGPPGTAVRISQLGRARRIDTQIAHDGLTVIVR